MLRKIVCENCGQINIINITEEQIAVMHEHAQRTIFGRERVHLVEKNIDKKECRYCGSCLTYQQ